MTPKSLKDPIVAIVGATGTGKSELAVELAKRFDGEVVNGDAMQLYAGLPIITNKITLEEQQGVPHHLLGCIGLHEQTWVVGMFVKKALKVIEEIRSRGKLPILVGGTHYYTQSLLFHDRLAKEDDFQSESEDVAAEESSEWQVLQQPTELLLQELNRVDPAMANRWHPNDRRKISRSLEIYLKTGKKASDLYADQRLRSSARLSENEGNGESTVPDSLTMRFPTILFWVHAETEVLRDRLDKRVENMLDQGLLDEVQSLNAYREAEAAQLRAVDETRGIWVSIGYKEFKTYEEALRKDHTSDAQLHQLNAEALERTQTATRQYSKRQVRWIRIKLLNALSEAGAGDQLYLLDGTDIPNFRESVVDPALHLTQLFLQAAEMPTPAIVTPAAAELLRPKNEHTRSVISGAWTKQHCEHCGTTCVTEEQWLQHVKSKAHRKLLSKRRKQQDGYLDGK